MDAASQELIRNMLLAEGYQDDLYMDLSEDDAAAQDDDSDDDWRSAKRRRGKKKRATSARAEKADRQPAAPRSQGSVQSYTQTETEAFLEALEVNGRDWKGMEKHMAAAGFSRTATNLRSKVQKHLIHLMRDRKPLPAKVAESGEGYTLSGKPLNLRSATVRATLGTDFDPEPYADLAGCFLGESTTGVLRKPEQAKGKKPAKKSAPAKRSRAPVSEEPAPVQDDGVRSEYAQKRLRSKNESKVGYGQYTEDAIQDPFKMVLCKQYAGEPGSGVHGSQPFKMVVSDCVLLMMDFHSHLLRREIIGFLAGSWDAESNTLNVSRAFPCRSMVSEEDIGDALESISVELDPASEAAMRIALDEVGLQVVGWYHSHPTFPPNPSLRDIENQNNYQVLFRDESLSTSRRIVAPFVGAIVSPFDESSRSAKSTINWFYAESDRATRAGQPMKLDYSLRSVRFDETTLRGDMERACELAEEDKAFKVNHSAVWRRVPVTETAGENGDPSVEAIVKTHEKLELSLIGNGCTGENGSHNEQWVKSTMESLLSALTSGGDDTSCEAAEGKEAEDADADDTTNKPNPKSKSKKTAARRGGRKQTS